MHQAINLALLQDQYCLISAMPQPPPTEHKEFSVFSVANDAIVWGLIMRIRSG
jgi:hypothetical protein